MNNIKIFCYIVMLLVQHQATALQIDSVSARKMNSYKKFDGLSQNAIVIKTSENHIRYVDRIEFSSGETQNRRFSFKCPRWSILCKFKHGNYLGFELGRLTDPLLSAANNSWNPTNGEYIRTRDHSSEITHNKLKK